MTNLYKYGQWAENQGLVGEKPTFLTGAAALMNGKPLGFGIESASGAGKSMTMDLITGDEHDNRPSLINSKYFYFKDAGSETSQFRDAARINSKKFMVIKELQKDKSHTTIEMIKSVTEGKVAVRKVTDMTKLNNEGEAGAVVEHTIKPMPIAYSLAIENDMKPDAELARRCITVNTDVSKTQTERVLKVKAQRLWDAKKCEIMSEDESDIILKHADAVVNTTVEVLNPYAPAFAEVIAKIAPDQKTRSIMGHFWNVAEGVTKINHLQHPLFVMDGGRLATLTNIQDMWQTMDIYLDNFIRDIHGIPPIGDIVLQGFKDAAIDPQSKVGKGKSSKNLSMYSEEISSGATAITINQCRTAIKKKQNISLKTKTVRDVCAQLVDAGYLEDDRSEKVVTYSTLDEFKHEKKPDAEWMLREAEKLVREKFPAQVDAWVENQRRPYIHPITGERVQIFAPEVELENDDLN